ncbi:hypothetical protein G6F22_019130 [Rhizopus arrhizus]|nr:hypothetical protein G6F22_019130 [Rhizopus arrhizus]
MAASMVKITTMPKKRMPTRGEMSVRPWNCTSAATTAPTSTSSIDQYPTNSTMRYNLARSRGAHRLRRWEVASNSPRIRNFAQGTATLAMKITNAMP